MRIVGTTLRQQFVIMDSQTALRYGQVNPEGGTMGAVIFAAAVGGGIGALIGSSKGNAKAGFWWGFLLGPIGWFQCL